MNSATVPIDETPLTGQGLADLVQAVESGEITGPAAKDVFAEMSRARAATLGRSSPSGVWPRCSDEAAIAGFVDEVLAANPDKVDQYRAGKTGLLGYFVGQVVRSSQGKANPQVVQRLLAARLG